MAIYTKITANLNWEILTKKSVTLKDGMGLRLKNLNREVHWKNLFVGGGGGSWKNNIQGELPKKGGLD